jgi:hypothetical protein
MFARIAVPAVLAGAIGVVVMGMPDLRRYLRIRSM